MAANWPFQPADLMCPICGREDNLYLLPCLHIRCHICIRDVGKEQGLCTGLYISCPRCPETYELEEEDINNLIQIKFDKKGYFPDNQISTFCTMCEAVGLQEVSSHCCEQCQDYLCNKCAMRHLATSSTKHHKVIPTASDEENNDDSQYVVSLEQNIPKCEEHSVHQQILQLKHFCTDCKLLLCEKCKEDHPHHNVQFLESFVHKNRDALQSQICMLKHKQADLCGQKDLVQELICRKERRHEDMTNKLIEFKHQLFQQIEDAIAKNISKMTKIAAEEIATLHSLKERLEGAKNSMRNAQKIADFFVHNSCNTDFTKGLHVLTQGIEQHFNKSKSEIFSNERASIKSFSQEEVREILKPFSEMIETEKIQEIHENPSCELEFYPKRIAYSADQLLVCDDSNIYICHQSRVEIGYADMGNIHDICVGEDKLFVAYVKEGQSMVAIFTAENWTNTAVLPLEEQKVCTHPSYHLGITSDKKGNLYICSKMTNKIYEWKFGYPTLSLYTENCTKPYAMCYTPKDELLVTSIDVLKICIYKKQLLMYEHNFKEFNDDVFLTGIEYDEMGNLFGCDFRNNHILMLQLGPYNCKSTKVAIENLHYPNAIACQHGKIAIVNQNQKRIAIWDMVMDI